MTDLENRIATLEIQCARLKAERDAALAESHEWVTEYQDLARMYDRQYEDLSAARRQCGDLSEGMVKALGMEWIVGPHGSCLPDDKAIIARAAETKRAMDEARETNQRYNRRVQKAESGALKDPFIKDYWRIKNELAFWQAQRSSESDRLLKTFDTFKRIFEAAAVVLDIPHERYHSVMDWCFKDTLYRFKPTDREPGQIFANVFLTKFGGVVSYDIAEVVEEAFATLRQNLIDTASEATHEQA